MQYRITKDCGTGWDPQSGGLAWGVSDRQRPLAEKVQAEDVFLHYIDHAHAWAGYSTATGTLQKNERDSHPDWRNALPWVLPIQKGVWLTEDQCEHTVNIQGLSGKAYHRQAVFTRIGDIEDTKRVIAAIDKAATRSGQQPSSEFDARWRQGAEAYYKQIVKDIAKGRCRLCRQDGASWVANWVDVNPRDEVTPKIIDSFLDAAHIVSRKNGGQVIPDNLRALCPNCHRVVDRLSQQLRERLLQGI